MKNNKKMPSYPECSICNRPIDCTRCDMCNLHCDCGNTSSGLGSDAKKVAMEVVELWLYCSGLYLAKFFALRW